MLMMSSQESTQGEGSKKRRRVVKRRRGRAAVAAPPGRLGWLGSGMSTMMSNDSSENAVAAAANKDLDGDNDCVHNASKGYSQGSCANDGGSGGDEGANNDDDEFTFKDSPPAGTDNCGRDHSKIRENGKHKEQQSVNSSWACRICTLLNPAKSSVCDACNTRRESTRKSKHDRGGNEKKKSGSSRHVSILDNGITESQHRSNGEKSRKLNKSNSDIMERKKKTNSRKKSDKSSLLKWASSSQQPLLSQNTFSSRSKLSSSIMAKKQQSKKNQLSKKSTTSNGEMWIDKYAPKNTKELCVAPKKIEEVRNFLSSHIEYTTSQRKRPPSDEESPPTKSFDPWEMPDNIKMAPPKTKLMILVGSPGVGKSAMVRALGHEMNVEIVTWNDVHVEYNMNHQQQSKSLDYSGGYLPYQSQLNSFEEFLMQGGVGMESLDVGSSVGESDASDGSRKNSNGEMKQNGDRKKNEHAGSLILIEEIPNLYSADAAQSFRNIMERHIQRTQIPTFFIFSDVQEGKHRPDDLERLIPPHILYSPLVQILPIQPVTKAKMKKCLQSIAKAEKLGGRGGASSLLSPDFLEETHMSSRGDLRHAIFAMQFRCCCPTAATATEMRSNNKNNTAKKDAKLSTFHALGKLLYAKRKQSNADQNYDSDDDLGAIKPSSDAAIRLSRSKWNDGRGPLEFVPEDVFNRIDMGIDSAITFLSYHSPDFFTDATDLSRSFDLMSDAVTFLDRFGQADGPFPTDYAACIGGRAVADGNRHPAPPQFRQFSAPKVFSVMKKNRENESKIDNLRKRLSMGGASGQRTSLHDNIGSANQFVTDSLPYMRTVIPHDVDYALATLHSYAKDSSGHASNEPQHALEEENKVLLEDDLVDDDDW